MVLRTRVQKNHQSVVSPWMACRPLFQLKTIMFYPKVAADIIQSPSWALSAIGSFILRATRYLHVMGACSAMKI